MKMKTRKLKRKFGLISKVRIYIYINLIYQKLTVAKSTIIMENRRNLIKKFISESEIQTESAQNSSSINLKISISSRYL